MSRRTLAILLVSAIPLVAGPVAAAPPGTLEAGPRVGLVTSTFTGAPIDDSPDRVSSKVGPMGSLLVRWLRGRWSVEGEIGVSDRGATMDRGGGAVGVHFYQLELPLVGVRSFTLTIPLVPRLVAGLSPSVRFAGGDLEDEEDTRPPIDRRFDIALVLGVGAAWPREGGTWLLDLRYLGGLRDLTAADRSGDEIRASALAITAGYTY